MPGNETRFIKQTSIYYYKTKNGYLYHNRIAKLCKKDHAKSIKERIEKYFDFFMVDEIQDLGGHDFNLLQAIIPTKINCLFVGDFFQHTFDTSQDGNTNKNLYKCYKKYISTWAKTGITVDETTLSNSYRCSPTTCQFVTEQLQIQISSHRQDNTNITFVDNQDDADTLFSDDSKVKLFYQESNKYPCYSDNWGSSKGLDNFNDVCIILNKKTLNEYKANKLNELAPSTKNKLYVACTRAKKNIYFIPHTFIDKYKD